METKQEAYLDQLLDLYRVQRHDFLNHFQVAMGYMQLGKGQAALDYLRQATGEVMELAPLSRVKPAELAVELLQLARCCASHDVEFTFKLPETLILNGWRAGHSQVMELVRRLISGSTGLLLKLASDKDVVAMEMRLDDVKHAQLVLVKEELLSLGVQVQDLGTGENGQAINLLVGL